MAKKKTVKKKAAKKKAAKKKATKKKAVKKAPSPATSSDVSSAAAEEKIAERRFELVEGSAAKFWTVRLNGDCIVTKYGRLGTTGQSNEKYYDDEAKAHKAYEKLVQQKEGKGYYEIKAPPKKPAADLKRERKQHEPFLKAILEKPDDIAAYAIYGDWLVEHGDPRGEFIHVQLALEDENLKGAQRKKLQQQEKRLLSKHQADWMGGYAEVLLNNPSVREVENYSDRRPNIRFRFERGFLAYLDVCHLYVPVARMIRDAQETQFLRELVIGEAAGVDSHDFDFEDEENSPYAFEWGPDLPKKSNTIAFVGLHPLDGIKRFPALRRFQIGEVSNMDSAASSSWGAPSCHTYFDTATELAEKMPRLQELQFLCKDFDIDQLFASKKLK